jgi:hypothetical protein
MTTTPNLDLLTEAPSDIAQRLTTRLTTLRAECHHLLKADAYLRSCRITDYHAGVRTRIADIRQEVTDISRHLHHLGQHAMAREALQGWPKTIRRPTRSARRSR